MNLFRYQVDAVKQLNEIIAYSLEKYELAKKKKSRRDINRSFYFYYG